MEKGLKWLFGGLIAAVVMMFILMVSNVDAQTFRFGDGEHGYFPSSTYYSFYMEPPILFIPDTNKNTTSSTQSFIQHSVNRDNEYQPNVTVNTPKPQR